jgi:hypothetical protein
VVRRRLTAAALLVAGATAPAWVLGGCGGASADEADKSVRDQHIRVAAAKRAAVEQAIRERKLPPIAVELFRPDGTIDVSFIDGPNHAEDVIRTRDHGRSGPPLRWDLDGDGRISRDERTITEAQLYSAMVPIMERAGDREMFG